MKIEANVTIFTESMSKYIVQRQLLSLYYHSHAKNSKAQRKTSV